VTTKETRKNVIEAALDLAEGVAGGTVDAADVTGAALEACRELVGTVVGPPDALWPLQVDIARQVLALDGIPANELDEWAAVVKRDQPAPAVSWIEQAMTDYDDDTEE
jgi:hypothetical protein